MQTKLASSLFFVTLRHSDSLLPYPHRTCFVLWYILEKSAGLDLRVTGELWKLPALQSTGNLPFRALTLVGVSLPIRHCWYLRTNKWFIKQVNKHVHFPSPVEQVHHQGWQGTESGSVLGGPCDSGGGRNGTTGHRPLNSSLPLK